MAELNFSTGLKEYELNGRYKLAFNPSDAAFARRLYGVFEAMQQKQEAYDEKLKATGDVTAIFDALEAIDREMRALIDGALGEGLCAAVFGEMNLTALADGFPVWVNLLLSVMDEIDESVAREIKLTNPRIEKYTKKYRKK